MIQLISLNIGDHFRFTDNEIDPIYEVFDITRVPNSSSKWKIKVQDIDTGKFQYCTGTEEVFEAIPIVAPGEDTLYLEEDEEDEL